MLQTQTHKGWKGFVPEYPFAHRVNFCTNVFLSIIHFEKKNEFVDLVCWKKSWSDSFVEA